jgi:hypothetical protein
MLTDAHGKPYSLTDEEITKLTVLPLHGKDNSGRPRQVFADKIAGMTEGEFVKEVEQYVWLSAYAANNPRSDYHWMCDATYYEARRRGNTDLYQRGHDAARKSAGH